MYSNFNFQFLENSGFFLRHHKGNINSLALALSISLTITRVGGGFPHYNPRWGREGSQSIISLFVFILKIDNYFCYNITK